MEKSGGGRLFSTDEELLAAMAEFQKDPGLRDELSRKGWQSYVDHWSESAVLPRYLEIVELAMERRRQRG